MKKILIVLGGVLLFCIDSRAQTPSTFDIMTFRSPSGWTKQVTQNSVQYSTENKAKGSYCLLTLFKSMPAIGSADQNFAAAWSTVVTEAVSPVSSPKMMPADTRDGWEVSNGYAPFEKDGGTGVAVLVTLTGNDRMMILLILTTPPNTSRRYLNS